MMENRGRGRGFSVAWSRRVERLGDIICENDIKAYTIQEVLKECSLSFKLSELLEFVRYM